MEENEKKKKEIYEKWWFWCIIVLIVLLVLIGAQIENSETQQTTETNQISENTTSENKIEKNPYIATQDYNGIYSFSLSSNNGNGYMYYAIGAISFNGEECKIKYSKLGETFSNEEIIELEGFCGINNQDDSTFNFIIKNKNNEELYTYRCIKNEKNLSCELKSVYDLAGCTNNKLDLVYVNDTQDIDTVYNNNISQEKAKKEAEKKAEKEKEKADFKASCQTYTFEQMARNPDNFKGTNVKLTGEVIQALYGSYSVDLRVNITKQGTYSTYYTDTVYITYTPEEGEDKILEDDIITIYGTSGGEYSYTSTMGTPVTLPLIYGKYIEIN